ncbi:peptide deformylase [Chromatiales bacterium (ex Bugula neritina AB1)]|nr:peptide deformylase [Chromatiales bacterium (ex Bugula neritina AB1)]
MTTLKIIDIGHPTLRVVGDEVPVDEIKSSAVQNFIDQLIATKREAKGAGIAANQVDNTRRIFVVEVGNNPRYPYKPAYPLCVMINPKITFLSEERFENFEGCLSIPNLRGVVHRCPHIRVQGYNRDAEAVDFEVKGISAGTFQHEDDHLNGVLFTDIIKDPTTLCTWEEFSLRYEDAFRESVEQVVAKYGS